MAKQFKKYIIYKTDISLVSAIPDRQRKYITERYEEDIETKINNDAKNLLKLQVSLLSTSSFTALQFKC